MLETRLETKATITLHNNGKDRTNTNSLPYHSKALAANCSAPYVTCSVGFDVRGGWRQRQSQITNEYREIERKNYVVYSTWNKNVFYTV